tara:strand:+ start:2831 stop:4039 length:1209 start_codon:yes stop_codon:yes gene_type:complete
MEINQKLKNEDFDNYYKIHWWEFPPNIMINLELSFRKKFFGEVISHFGKSLDVGIFLCKIAKKYGYKRLDKGSKVRTYKTSNKRNIYVPQWTLKELTLKIGYNLYEIERYIQAYRARAGSSIINPILPIKVTPEFDSILSHIMGDGTEKRTKNIAASYIQYNIKGRINFYKKLLNVFGDIDPPSFTKQRKGMDVGIPKAILLIIKHHYSIKNISTYESCIPKQFLSKSNEQKLAILCSFLVDEGSIYDLISLRMKNYGVIHSLRKMTCSLGYKCSKINKFKDHTGDFVFGFNISNSSLNKMASDIKQLSQKYPTCDFAHKQTDFNILASGKRTTERTRYFGETKKLMLNFLKSTPKTAMELARLVNICRRTARIHIEDLKNSNKLELDYVKSKGAKVWKLKI